MNIENYKQRISEEYKEFVYNQYGDNELDHRKELDQFYTPATSTINVLKLYLTDAVTTLKGQYILDPTCGSGNLLTGALLCGADIEKLFGNEFDESMVELCRQRLFLACRKYRKDYDKVTDIDLKNIIKRNIHQGNALIADCLTQFSSDYDETLLPELLKRRNGMSGGFMNNPDKYIEWKKEHCKNKEHAERTEQIVQEQENQTEEELW